MSTPDAVAGVVVGAGNPLTAAYCAERSADAIARSEGLPADMAGALLLAAGHWRDLGVALATNPALSRPRDDGDGGRTERTRR